MKLQPARSNKGDAVDVLFITWDGPNSSYLESLFLPIISKLAAFGYRFHVLQFTWSATTTALELTESAQKLGISYRRVEVMRRPLAIGSLATAFFGAWSVMRLVREHHIRVLMPRSIMPGLAALIAKRMNPRLRLLFDADGLPVDERVDFGGLSPISTTARLLWAIERMLLKAADGVITRSQAAISILQRRSHRASPVKFFRVANCRDETQFSPISEDALARVKNELGVPEQAPLLGYVGSGMTGKYRGDLLLELYRRIKSRRDDCHLLLLTNQISEAQALVSDLAGSHADGIHIRQSAPQAVSEYLAACDAGVALIEPKPSMRAASAVKVGEYLLCGLPVIATAGVGDDQQLLASDACFFLRNNTAPELDRAAQWFCNSLLPRNSELAAEARLLGEANYSLTRGVFDYARALDWASGRSASDLKRSTTRGACEASE